MSSVVRALMLVCTCAAIAQAWRVNAQEPADEVIIGDLPAPLGAQAASAAAPLPLPAANPFDDRPPATLPRGNSPYTPLEFDGVQPGIASKADVRQIWGDPLSSGEEAGTTICKYRREPFKQVEVAFRGEQVQLVTVELGEQFSAGEVARQLELSEFAPAMIFDGAEVCRGQVYPERGVVLRWDASARPTPSDGVAKVAEVAFGRIEPHYFLLRAQARAESEDETALADVDAAIDLDPVSTSAFALKAKLLWRLGRREEALHCITRALKVDAQSPEARLLYARLLAEQGDWQQAISETRRAISLSSTSSITRARGFVQLGELIATAEEPNYHEPVEHYQGAIKLAEPILRDPQPSIRQAAGEVLLDAHLAMAYAIAWGRWQMKPMAVEKWLERAAVLSEELPEAEAEARASQMRVCQAALAACAGAPGKIDPTKWAEQACELGQSRLAEARDPLYRQRLQWQLGLALHDALQSLQARQELDSALKYGELAVECLEQGAPGRQLTSDEAYMLGRLYYRVGTLLATQRGNHRQAIACYEKAFPLFEQSAPATLRCEQHGEMLVTAAISYWNERQCDKAVLLTSQGIKLFEQAVEQGIIEKSVLSTPYANLAAMHEQLGDRVQAASYAEQASHLEVDPVVRQ